MDKLVLLQLDDYELKLAQNKDSENNALAFAVMLKYFQLESHYPTSLSDIDDQLLRALTDQLEIKSFDLGTFDWDGRTVKRFRAEIRDYLGYRKATDADAQPFILWLMQEHLKHAPSLEKTVEFAYEYFKQKRIEPFREKQLLRYIKSANAQFEDHVFNNVYQALSSKSLDHIEILLKQQEEEDEVEEKQLEKHIELMSEKESNENIKEKITPETDVRLRHLKQDIPGAKLKHVEFELKKMALVKQCVLPQDLLEEYPIELVKKYYLRILVEHAGLIKRRSKKDYCAMTALFLHYRSQNMLDSLSDMTVQLIHGLRKKSETYINKTVLKEVKHINGKFDILYRLASVSTQYPQGIIQDKIYPIVSEDMLRDLLTDLDHRGKWYQGEVNLKIHSLYAGGSRQVLLTLLEAFDLRTHLPECKPILAALDFIRKNKELKDVYYPDTSKVLIDNVIPSQWSNLVIQPDGDNSDKVKIHKIRYEIAVLEAFMKQLICKNIWISGSYRYRDPYHDMPKDFDERKVFYYDWMGLPIEAKSFIELLKNNTHQALARLNETLPNNEKVKLRQLKKGNRITLTPYDAQPEPPTLHKLHVAIQKKWSTINLIDILKETDLREDFTRHLQSVACREHLPRDILTKRGSINFNGIRLRNF